MTTDARIERGDWQTPLALADAVVAHVAAKLTRPPSVIVEPTCGEGAFIVAAARRFPRARVAAWEIDATYTRKARAALRRSGASGSIERADFFDIAWERELAALNGPLLVLGNPPWVTSAQLGALSSSNAPVKDNSARLLGLDAVTGKSNFDVSEWMIVRLLEALRGREATLAMLCKAAVARKVALAVTSRSLDVTPIGLWRIDAAAHFDASVSAVLLMAKSGSAKKADAGTKARHATPTWPVYASLDADRPESSLGVVDGVLVADSARFERTRHLAGSCEPEWRSGVKHDCARVMELHREGAGAGDSRRGGTWRNGLGEQVDIEDELVLPLLKSSDVANARPVGARAMIVPQRALGEDTTALRKRAPRAWRYLSRHRALLEARKSSIYEGQPPFAIFGVGPYSFAPWKVAVSGLYKRSVFTVIGPHEGQPVVLDDTCYFLALPDERSAQRVAAALRSPAAREFFAARIFWDAKRPITKAILQSLDLKALERATLAARPV